MRSDTQGHHLIHSSPSSYLYLDIRALFSPPLLPRRRFDDMYNPAKVSNNPPPPTPTVSSRADVEAKMKSMAVRVTEEYRSTTSVEEGMDKFADALDHGLAAAMSYYSGAAARPLGHTKFASSAPQATAQPRPPQPGAAAGGLFGTPLHLLSESTRHSSIKASYDPLLSPPTAIMSLLDAVEAGMDAPGLFHSGLSTPPPPHVLDAVERDGSVPPSDSAAVDAAAVLVHWLRCLPGSLVGNREALLAASNLGGRLARPRPRPRPRGRLRRPRPPHSRFGLLFPGRTPRLHKA